MDKYPGNLKASVVFTRNDLSETNGIMADCLYLAHAGAGFADASCPVLHKMLFDYGSEYTAGWGVSKSEIHISNWKHEAICGWRPRSMYVENQVTPLVKYDTKYKVCIKCRRALEGGE